MRAGVVTALAIALATVADAGWAAGVPVRIDEPPAGRANIVFFRRGHLQDALINLTVNEGPVGLGPLGWDSYLVVAATPGLHTYGFREDGNDVQIVVEAGETYYVRFELDVNDLVTLTPAEQRQFDDVSRWLHPAMTGKAVEATEGAQ